MMNFIFKVIPFIKGKQLSFKKSIPSNDSIVVTYDLFKNLKEIKHITLDKYKIIDLKLLWTILQLGRYHKNYFEESKLQMPFEAYNSQNAFLAEYPWILDIADETKRNACLKQLTRLCVKLKNRAIETGVWWHYINIEIPFTISLFNLTTKGISIDQVKVASCQNKLQNALNKVYYALEQNNLYGREIKDLNNWVRGFGFDEYLPRNDADIERKDLKLLSDRHPVFELFRRIDKIKRARSILTKLTGYPKVWPKYKIIGTATARCTASAPNIMGLPKIFRPVVIPINKEYGIVECDYSQMEVGVIAGLSNDENLMNDYNNQDVYKITAKWLFGSQGSDRRDIAKALFLGILYGMSIKTIAKLIDSDLVETRNILNQLFKRYQRLNNYLSQLESYGTKNGYVKSCTGLKRYRYDKVTEPSFWEKNWFKNFPVQASASAVFKKAIINLYQKLNTESFNLLVPLYDSIVFEVPLTQLGYFTNIVCDCMVKSMKEFFPKLQPKITVNNACPSCWCSDGDANSIEEFLDRPLCGIDLSKGKSGNVDWSKYL